MGFEGKAIKNGLNNYMSQKDMLDIFTLLFSKKMSMGTEFFDNHPIDNIKKL